MKELNDDCLYREKQIVWDRRTDTQPIVPVSHSTWWKGIKDGIYPPGRKVSARVTVWRGADLRKVVEGTWEAQE